VQQGLGICDDPRTYRQSLCCFIPGFLHWPRKTDSKVDSARHHCQQGKHWTCTSLNTPSVHELDITVLQESYGDLPDLSPILAQLQQANRPGSKFEHHDNADFVNMISYIQILGIALTNIPGYVTEERKTVASEKDEKSEKMTPLRMIRTELETLHGRICTSPQQHPLSEG
jgi:hypothetical protein